MTFEQHLDRLLAPTPQPMGWTMPDANQHAWFVNACALPETPVVETHPPQRPVLHLAPAGDDGDAPPPQPQSTPNQPRLVVWNDAQRAAIDVLSRLGARLHAHVSLETARREWRRLARQLHPDSGTNGGSVHAFAQAAQAWDVLQSGPLVVEDTGTFAAGLR